MRQNKTRLDSAVKIAVLLQCVIAIMMCWFTYLQFSLNRNMEKRFVLEKSLAIKNSLADLVFSEKETLNEAKIRNIMEWTEEVLK